MENPVGLNRANHPADGAAILQFAVDDGNFPRSDEAPQAGLIALLSGLVVYALIGTSRYAIVSATSSSAAVLAATVLSEPGMSAATQLTMAAALIIATGVLFILAGTARLGGMSDFIARPVLRGFTFGLALTIVIKQLPKILDLHVHHSDTPRIAFDLVREAAQANQYSTALGGTALALLFALGRWGRIPATLVVIVLALAAGYWIDWHQYGIAIVGTIGTPTNSATPTSPGH